MALADIILNDGQGTPVAHTFTYISNVNGRTVRTDMAASAETPLIMTHAHQDGKRAGVVVKSHLFRIDKTLLDADGVTAHVANVRVMCDVPVPISSDALADDLAAFIRNWITSANFRAFIKGSVG
mgnify:FL=1